MVDVNKIVEDAINGLQVMEYPFEIEHDKMRCSICSSLFEWEGDLNTHEYHNNCWLANIKMWHIQQVIAIKYTGHHGNAIGLASGYSLAGGVVR